MNHMIEKPGWRSNAVGLWIVTVLMLLLSIVLLVLCVIQGMQYTYVKQAGVVVQAEACEYKAFSDDGDIDYRVYLCYTFEGKNYSIGSETYDSEEEAKAMLGKTVQLCIHPDDPLVQLEDIGSSVQFFSFMLACVLLFAIVLLIERKRKLYTEVYGFTDEYIQLDLNRQLLNNSGVWVAFLSSGCVLLILWLFFPLALDSYCIMAIAGIIIGLISFCRWMKQAKLVFEGEYYLTRQTLCDKKINEGVETTTYELCYTDGSQTWTKQVTKKRYHTAYVGEVSQTIFLNGAKSPFMTTNIIE